MMLLRCLSKKNLKHKCQALATHLVRLLSLSSVYSIFSTGKTQELTNQSYCGLFFFFEVHVIFGGTFGKAREPLVASATS